MFLLLLLCSALTGWRHNALTAVVCPSVRPSVCSVHGPKSRPEGRRKLEIGGKSPWQWWSVTAFRGRKVKVTGPLNAVTENQPKLRLSQHVATTAAETDLQQHDCHAQSNAMEIKRSSVVLYRRQQAWWRSSGFYFRTAHVASTRTVTNRINTPNFE